MTANIAIGSREDSIGSRNSFSDTLIVITATAWIRALQVVAILFEELPSISTGILEE
jgi:hypothetical protein